MIFLKCKIRFIYVGFNWKRKKGGVKKRLEICAIKGGGGRGGRLMANTILNFHFDYWNPSLRQLSVLWAIIGFKMNDIINGDIFVMIEIESFCSKSILPCYLLLFCYCIITRVSTTMLSNFYADLNAEEGAKSLMAMWLLILILLFSCFVMWSSDLKKNRTIFGGPGMEKEHQSKPLPPQTK